MKHPPGLSVGKLPLSSNGLWRLPAAVWLALLLAHALAGTYALRTGRYTFPDSGRYRQVAQNLGQHGQLYARPLPPYPPTGQDVQEFTIRPPGYPLLVLAVGAPVGILLLQNLLSLGALAVVLRGWAAARARPPSSPEWAVALALALSFPAQLIYANVVMSEIPLQAVLLGGVGLAAAFARTGRARYLAGVATALVAAWLLKPVLAPFTLVFLGISSWLAWQRRRPILALFGALPLLLALAYMGWNAQRTGYFHFSSIAEINLLHYNAAGVLRQAQGPAAEATWVARTLRAANAAPTFAARQRLIDAAAGAVLRRYPLLYAGQHALGMATFFLDPGRFDASVFLGQTQAAGLLNQLRGGGAAGLLGALAQQPWGLLALLLITAVANVLRLALAVRGLRTASAHAPTSPDWLGFATPAGRWVAAGLLLYLAVLTGPLGAARFLVPGWPLLLALALRGLPDAKPARY
ncbi:hypothetical protein GO988_18905 [Hymenobacter sp. HMF4947]|uniref:Glycosyltransferase RgtA/B/C/D-like domain-containing protein n=1 Tax=Hymenobacter ginkgonis TaxID=2682976 RepID=A0A7K1TJ37_9BACT|nr:hypothetical protein [Hymenobacter ginkgonis]MVN78405.1 hypothetical protein [Hymenobacter ginkgonis]